jgi:hypothetical protein
MVSTKRLTFRVQRTAHGELGETLRTTSLNGNAEIARVAFEAAVRCVATVMGLLCWRKIRAQRPGPLEVSVHV